MASIRSILGDIEGSAGQLTFAKVNGKNIMRQKVGKNSSNTPGQQAVRSSFSKLAAQYKYLKTVAGLGFKKLGAQSPYNRFIGENYENTSVDQALVASIDYTKMLISDGSVLGIDGLNVTASANTASFAWEDNTNGTTGLANDLATLVVVNTVTGQAFSYHGNAALGLPVSDRSATLTGAVIVPGLTVANKANYVAYAYFTRADGSDASPSAYEALA